MNVIPFRTKSADADRANGTDALAEAQWRSFLREEEARPKRDEVSPCRRPV